MNSSHVDNSKGAYALQENAAIFFSKRVTSNEIEADQRPEPGIPAAGEQWSPSQGGEHGPAEVLPTSASTGNSAADEVAPSLPLEEAMYVLPRRDVCVKKWGGGEHPE